MIMESEELSIGDRLTLKPLDNYSKKKYTSQVLDKINDKVYIVSGPIEKNVLVPLHINSLVEMNYYKKNKGRFVFKAKVIGREKKEVYKLKIKKINNITKSQDRNYYRLPIMLNVTKYHEDDDTSDNDLVEECCITENISGNGMKILCNYQHDIGDEIQCEVHIDGNSYLIKCKVVRQAKIDNPKYKYGVGIEYVDLKASDRDNIVKYIFNEQRKLRRKGLI